MVILRLDFVNAFDTAACNLMISLGARTCLELTNLTWWLYNMIPRLLTSSGDIICSATGTQQDVAFPTHSSNSSCNTFKKSSRISPDFDKHFSQGRYHTHPDAQSLAEVAKIINDCSPRTGLRLRWKNAYCMAPVPPSMPAG